MAEDTVFKDARDIFLASLQPSEKTLFISCNNADDLLKQLRTHDAFKPKRSLIRQFMAKIEEFGESLTPFFGAIGLVVQSHPEIAAIVWGAIRLVIQVRRTNKYRRSANISSWQAISTRSFGN